MSLAHLAKYVMVFVLALMEVAFVTAQTAPTWQQIEQTSNVEEKVALATALAKYAKHRLDDPKLADSASFFAVKSAFATLSLSAQTLALKEFIKNANLQRMAEPIKPYVKRYKKIAGTEYAWQAAYFECKLAQSRYDYEAALSLAKQTLTLPNLDSLKRGLSYLMVGESFSLLNEKPLALQYLLRAEDLIETYGDFDQKIELYQVIIEFYVSTGLFDEASRVCKMMQAQVSKNHPADRVAYFEAKFNAFNIAVLAKPEQVNTKALEEAIAQTVTKRYRLHEHNFLALYRSYLIQSENFAGLANLYRERYPLKFEEIRKENKELYYRMQAYFFEVDGLRDSALVNWKRALAYIETQTDLPRKSNLYIRYAEFLTRAKNFDEALIYYEKGAQMSREAKYPDFELLALQRMQHIYELRGDFAEAYRLSERAHNLASEIERNNEQDKLVLTQVIHRANIMQAEQQTTIAAQRRRAIALGSGVIVLLVLAGLFFYQYRQTRIQKERSDELLLNILPKETAAELKQKGSTTAERFNNVTILFADIVGFSKVAETLEPQQLVAIIDKYFRAFDDICTVFGLEKIKTIGDAYVAVGGLPAGNKATAVDVAKAALSMQRVTKQLNEERGEKPFHLRIGLNTGDVVAGVVGSRKFQFDIWGDAVNVAARMEQYCEADKVNISESTYQRVNTHFVCLYRGKIEAKNKGLLDMYFLEESRNETKA